MIELPEANSLAAQLNKTIKGKKIESVLGAYSPHKFAWYTGDPIEYQSKLKGKTIGEAKACGGQVEIVAGDYSLLFSDGVNLRYWEKDAKRPAKHQLLIEFGDGTALSGSVQMYGGLTCFKPAEHDDKYYLMSKTKPSPLSAEFNQPYFDAIIDAPESQNLSLKALLATEQRIPGLGNGVLQDILFNAGFHPKRKVSMLNAGERKKLFQAVKATLKEMTDKGGRDTEKGLYGEAGGYKTKLSSLTVAQPCGVCGGLIVKLAYMGGSIYFCQTCQKFE